MGTYHQQDQKNKLNGYGDVEHGPMSEANRQCRDILCALMFMFMVAAMVYMSIYGYTNGNLSKPFRATDMNGNVCGDPSGVAANYPYAYFFNPTTLDLSNRYCVDSCPSYSNAALSTLSCYGQASCSYAVTILANGSYSVSPTSTSLIIGYQTTSLISRVCVPTSTVFTNAFSSYASTFSSYLSQGAFSEFITDIQNNWQWLLCALGGAVVISFIFMYLLKCLAGLIVWTSAFGIIIFFALAGVVFLNNAGIINISSIASGYLSIPAISGATTTEYQIFGYASFAIAGFFLLLLVCCCGRIRIAVAVCKAAGQFVAHNCGIVLVPVVQSAVNLGMWAVCIVALLYLASSATYTVSSGSIFTNLSSYTDSALIQFYMFLFGTLWCNAFIQAVGIFVIASACCIWYYNHGPEQEINFPIFRSYKMVLRYHLGSLAFGSLILAIVQFIEIVLELVKKQAEANGAANNKCFEYAINCLRCCMQCVERLVQFINKTAYIQIALRGQNFCSAAKDGFEIVWSNPARYAIVGGVGQIMMVLGELMIATGTTFAFYCFITYVSSIKSNVLQPIYLLILVFIASFAVAMLFTSVYSISMDTILQCFIVDEANQKKKGGKTALYAPEEIQGLIDAPEE